MDTTVLSRALLLLLFLHLSPQGSHSYPLGDSSETSQKFPGLQELLERILMQLSQLEIEQLATESSQPTESTTQTWETRQTQETQETTAAPRLRQSQDGTIQALDKSYSIQMKQKLGCFGRRLDRIGSSRSLGCNGFRKP
ncbi:natriuretic peptides B [Ochotona curzoniae]|uniref:natriuretic peptides B n=1 Tax=Ochotona curzoniae TaxID=130825 RepID=UPI001B34AB97|nr:natriuretic peptides B [Ochotona curzoniae]